jgi:hypothetical protein
MKRAIAVAVFAIAPAASADEVFLRGGGSIRGEVVAQTAASVVVEVGPGRMTLPMSRVERIVASTSAISVYRERAARLAAGDVAGWLALARWAEDADLLTQARGAYEHVVAIDPGNAAANGALGRVQMAGRWVSPEESHRARGLVSFEGRWVTPDERSAILAERTAEARVREMSVEAEARAREAEARARAAEADARRAEAEAAQAETASAGIPYPFVFGGVGPYGDVYGTGSHRGSGRHGGRSHGGARHGRHEKPPSVEVDPSPPARDEAGVAAARRARSRQNR